MNLRFIVRNGERVLQQEMVSDGNPYIKEWQDVPQVEAVKPREFIWNGYIGALTEITIGLNNVPDRDHEIKLTQVIPGARQITRDEAIRVFDELWTCHRHDSFAEKLNYLLKELGFDNDQS